MHDVSQKGVMLHEGHKCIRLIRHSSATCQLPSLTPRGYCIPESNGDAGSHSWSSKEEIVIPASTSRFTLAFKYWKQEWKSTEIECLSEKGCKKEAAWVMCLHLAQYVWISRKSLRAKCVFDPIFDALKLGQCSQLQKWIGSSYTPITCLVSTNGVKVAH